MASLYEILGVSQGASAEDIRQAYRHAALRMHPDKAGRSQQPPPDATAGGGGGGGSPAAVGGSEPAAAGFLDLQRAWEVLQDPQRRQEYDRRLALDASRREVHINEDVGLGEMGLESIGDGGRCYTWPCRCGGQFLLPEEDCNGSADAVLVPCSTCSLHIQVATTH